MPDTVTGRAIWTLFILTGLLTSFPVFRQVDGAILRALHKGANVRIGVKTTAKCLLDVNFEPNQSVSSRFFTGIRTHHFREVIAGHEEGALERAWFELRCMHKVVRHFVLNCDVPLFQSLIQTDLDETARCVEMLRDHLF